MRAEYSFNFRSGLVGLLAGVMCALSPTGCTDVDLEPIPLGRPFLDNKLAVVGNLCTTPPESKVFPLRVLFVVDASESMLVNDPPDPVTGETGRERAVRETWENLLAGGPEGVRIGIIRFSSEAQSRTPVDFNLDGLADSYFTADQAQLGAATLALRSTDRKTNYLNALSEAYFEIRTELMAADKESLPLSKYVVVFVSDGVPQTEDEDERENSLENILQAVKMIKELGDLFHVGDMKVHTSYLSSTEGTILDQEAQDLLQKMADMGEGNFRSFPSGETINFLFVDFTIIRRVFTLKTLSVTNANAIVDHAQIKNLTFVPRPREFVDLDGDAEPTCGEPLVDTDSDGLADFMEDELGTDKHVPDTDDDGLYDRLEWRFATSGLDPLDPTDARCFIPEPCVDTTPADGYCDCLIDLDVNGVCDCVNDPDRPCHDALGHDCVDDDVDGLCDCPDLDRDGLCDYGDRDGDGLNDCSEIFFGTAQNGNDTDADGLPDWREVRAQSNPGERDWLDDADWDQTRNGTEVLAGTDPWCDDSSVRSLVSIQYDLDTEGLNDGRSCYSFEVRNITLVPTAANLEETYPGGTFSRIPGTDDYPGNGWNRILVFFGEVSFDDPESFAAYRIACVMARYEPRGNYKNPPSGRVRLTDEDFHDAREEFDADVHCIWP